MPDAEGDAAGDIDVDVSLRRTTTPGSERDADDQQLEEMALRRTEEDLARMSIVKGRHPADQQSVAIKEELQEFRDGRGYAHVGRTFDRREAFYLRNVAKQLKPAASKAKRGKKSKKGKKDKEAAGASNAHLASSADAVPIKQLTQDEKNAQARAFCKQVGLAVRGQQTKKAQATEWRLARKAYRSAFSGRAQMPEVGWIAGLQQRWMDKNGRSPLDASDRQRRRRATFRSCKQKALAEFNGRMRLYQAVAREG